MKLHFIAGTGRCGSSLVHEILARHEHAAFVSNVDDNLRWIRSKGRFNGAVYSATPASWTRKGRFRFAPSEAYGLISREVSPLYANSTRDLVATDVTPWVRCRFKEFFASRCAMQRKPFFLHKYTGWSRIGFFAEIFPDARFLNVVRDGRAVANSWLQMPWWGGYRGPEHWQWGPLSEEHNEEWEASGRSYVTLAAICWKMLMQSYEQAAAQLPPARYMEVKYEHFLFEPRETLRKTAEFLELPSSERLDEALSAQALSPARARAFERDLTSAQRAQLERSLQTALHRYGYVD